MPVSDAVYQRADAPLETRVEDLLARMTLAEKLDQLHQCGIGDTNPQNVATKADELRPTYGSFIVGGSDTLFDVRNALQKRAVEDTRLGIPAIFGSDVIHGYRTIGPIPLAQACSWNPELVEAASAAAAEEATAQGIDWTFAPMVDHCVDPRWGRIAETFGESPYASSVFAVASVRGFQGDDASGPTKMAACLKHYVGYGASEGGRDYSYTEISPQSLWELHLPPFEAGVKAGAMTLMSAFNDISGEPASANSYTLTHVLRDRWGFKGLVVSDWNAVQQLTHQGAAADEAEAVALALAAGVDMDMADGLYREKVPALLEDGRVTMAEVDQAVRRVLRLKFELGLFERPYAERTALTGAAPTASHLALAEELAARSIVVLKNVGVLPLVGATSRVALIGPLAEHREALLGSWAQHGQPAEVQTIAEALRERLPTGAELAVVRGCSTVEELPLDMAGAVAAAAASDVVILALGEERWMSGENGSRASIRLPGHQEELARAVIATGKPVVLVLVTGRPVDIAEFDPTVKAVVAAWQGGTRAAAALSDVLLGRREPVGRLAVTWPRSGGQIPTSHLQRPRARLGAEGAYQDADTSALYAFGAGLGYTTFAYGPITLSAPTVRFGGELTAQVRVTNTGTRVGTETAFWFTRDPAARITRPLRELKRFSQLTLAPGESGDVTVILRPTENLAYPDADGNPICEGGEIVLMIGDQRATFRVEL